MTVGGCAALFCSGLLSAFLGWRGRKKGRGAQAAFVLGLLMAGAALGYTLTALILLGGVG